MKIRIKGNSIRIRLSRSEVDMFGEIGYIEEKTEFGTTDLIYALQRFSGNSLSASFSGNSITMHVPEAMANEWVTSETVGYHHNLDIGNGKQLFLLLEKDFKCIDAPAYEDQSDNYEHPKGTC